MKKIESKEVFYCDNCSIEIGLETPIKHLMGRVYGSTGVVYEPKVKGDYCNSCLNHLQNNWDEYGQKGFIGERYDTVNEESIKEEVEALRVYIRNQEGY